MPVFRRVSGSASISAVAVQTAGSAEMLAADVVSLSDGGGKVSAARRPILGREAVVRFVFGLLSKAPPAYRVSVAEVNGAARRGSRCEGAGDCRPDEAAPDQRRCHGDTSGWSA